MLADTRPLQQPDFRRLWIAQIITVIGAQLTVIAVPVQIYAITGSSAFVGLTGVFGFVPLLIFGLWGGALADHMDRRRLIVITTVGLIATATLFWVQAALGNRNVWLLLILFAVQQAFFAVSQPTRAAIIPRLVPAEQLPAANSLSVTVFTGGAVVGPLLGGALIPLIGLPWLYAIDALALLAPLWAALRLPSLPVDTTSGSTPGLRSILDGLRYLKGQPILLISFVIDMIAMVAGLPRALIPEIAHVDFGGPDEGGLALAVLFAAMPAGAFLGGVLSGWVSRVERHGLAVVLSVCVWGLAIIGMGIAVWLADGRASPWLWIAAACLAIGGAADLVSMAFRGAMLQSVATDEMRGRLQGVFLIVVAGGPRLADVVHGAAAVWVGTAIATAGGGVLVVVGTVLAALLVPAFVRYRVTSPVTAR